MKTPSERANAAAPSAEDCGTLPAVLCLLLNAAGSGVTGGPGGKGGVGVRSHLLRARVPLLEDGPCPLRLAEDGKQRRGAGLVAAQHPVLHVVWAGQRNGVTVSERRRKLWAITSPGRERPAEMAIREREGGFQGLGFRVKP